MKRIIILIKNTAEVHVIWQVVDDEGSYMEQVQQYCASKKIPFELENIEFMPNWSGKIRFESLKPMSQVLAAPSEDERE